jgi:hypothetical protein
VESRWLSRYNDQATVWTIGKLGTHSEQRSRRLQSLPSPLFSGCRWLFPREYPEDKSRMLRQAVFLVFFFLRLYSPCGPWPLLQFPNLYTQLVGPLGRGISTPQSRCLHTEQHKHRINATDIHALGWIRTPAFERAKTLHALDRASTMIGVSLVYITIKKSADIKYY